ncbi:terminase small subunit [Lysinibacillus sphaericus]|uniref:terminase small subunit n=1 Tax=Lysinibacillus sphaericus TaxID=1421 RepID=UPI0039837573
MIERKLTVKQQAFADHYIELGNAVDAAIKAGYSKITQMHRVTICWIMLEWKTK